MNYTHHNPIDFRVVHFVVVPVECHLPNCQCSMNCGQISRVLGCRWQIGVDVIHGWYDSANAWGITREKESVMFIYLGQFNEITSDAME